MDNGIIVPGAALAATNGGTGPDLFVPSTTGAPFTGFSCSFVVNQMGAESLFPQNGAELVVTTYEIIGLPGITSPLTICPTNDPLTPATLNIAGGGTVIPESVDGEVTVLVPSEPFRRGDCNGTVSSILRIPSSWSRVSHRYRERPFPTASRRATLTTTVWSAGAIPSFTSSKYLAEGFS